MTSATDKKGGISLAEMRDLCARHWNPIGIPMASIATSSDLGFRPLPEDEYDTYLRHIVRLVGDGASPKQVADYVGTVEKDYIQVISPLGSKEDFVSAIFKLVNRSPTQ
ncbi:MULTISPECIES: hypothetical protein [unclassified Mesorhizobium]|uniref:hypothetical protein n=1 Tax=unclassified Mesorhizobium TaxID=325217 RepID=UPI003336371A